MAIKIIKHKIEQEKLAYKFLCDCGCAVSMVPNLELNIMPRNKIFDE